MSDKILRKEKELELLKAEAAFAEKKASSAGVSMNDKLALRALRADFRLNYRKATKSGAQPAAVTAKAKVK